MTRFEVLVLEQNDYMTKPFSPSELVARVKAHMARYERLVGSGVQENEIIEIRGIKIDKTARRVVGSMAKRKHLPLKSLTCSHFLHRIRIMYLQRKNCSARSGIWSLLEILRP